MQSILKPCASPLRALRLTLALVALVPLASAAVAQEPSPASSAAAFEPTAALQLSALLGADLVEQQRLLINEPAANDRAGASLAISGDTALLGVIGQDLRGAVHVFVRNGATWQQQATLLAADGADGDLFGYAVALEGDTALIGALHADAFQGAAYVFTRSGSSWSEQARLSAADGVAGDRFGTAVSLSGDSALVGAYVDDDASVDQGSAYVFVRSGGSWSEQARLTAADGEASDLFGSAVALSGDTAVIGATFGGAGGVEHGSAYVFVRSAGTWTEQQELVASDAAAGDEFGTAVAVSGDTVLVGAPFNMVSSASQGAAYVFQRSAGTWSQQARLLAADAGYQDYFGSAVALHADVALVGAYGDNIAGGGAVRQGSAYLFSRSGVSWSEQQKLIASDGLAGDEFGRSVALSAEHVLAGAPVRSGDYSNQGAAYVFGEAQANSTAITAAAPNPSLLGESLPVEVTVSGALSAPIDGQVTVTASTGETCTGTTAQAGAGSSSVFGCGITFNTLGHRSLVANYSSSSTHQDSTSPAQSHWVSTVLTVTPELLPDGSFDVPYSQVLAASGPGSSAPYFYSVSAGSLPSGLFLIATTGEITGTPDAVGSASFTITASDSSDDTIGGAFTGSREYVIEIVRAPQAALVVSASPAEIAVGGSTTLSTSGGSGTGAVSFALTAGAQHCALAGNTLTGTAAGPCTVSATRAGDANYLPTSNSLELQVARASQTITFAAAPPLTVDASAQVSASGGASGNPVIFSSGSPLACSVSSNTVAGLSAATCTILANQAGDANYEPASETSLEIVVGRGSQSIDFSAPADRPLDAGSFVINASGGSSTSPVLITSLSTATCGSGGSNGATISLLAAGTCTLRASQAGDANYHAAADVEQHFEILSATPSVVLVSDQNPADVGSPLTLTATVSGLNPTGSVAFFNDATGIEGCASRPLSGSGNSRTASCAVNTLSVGEHSLVAMYSGDANHLQETSEALLQQINALPKGPSLAIERLHPDPADSLADAIAAGSALASYRIALSNDSSDTFAGVRLRVNSSALISPLWECSASGAADCGDAQGSGTVDQQLDLPVGEIVQIELSGAMDTEGNFIEISAAVDFGESAGQMPLREVLLDPLHPDALFRAGFE